MGLLRDATAVVLSVIGLAGLGMTSAALAQTPQSQCSLLSGRPCHPSFCGVFHGGPCLPCYLPLIGEVVQGMDVVDKLKRGEPPSDPDRMVRVQVAADVEE